MEVKISIQRSNAKSRSIPFQSFWRPGVFSLEIHIKEQDVVFYCKQSHEYAGTSLTNCVELIRQEAFEFMRREGLIETDVQLSMWEKLFLSLAEREQLIQSAIDIYMRKHSQWINHTKAIDTQGKDRFALINFVNGEAAFNFVNRRDINKEYPEIDISEINPLAVEEPTSMENIR